ncbi:MAG: hypothetical protein J1F35_08065 [Erysipelotrichales bacterium]|nr:hypothetical protein [Erysipelotrichales bacterium]
MKSLSQFIVENKVHGTFNEEVNISMKQFESLKKDLKDKYEFLYSEDNQIYTIHEKSDKKFFVGDHLATYVCKTGKLYFDSEGPLSEAIEKYIK